MKPSAVERALEKLASPKKAAALSRFFKTGKGQYGEGDVFLGIMVPDQRMVAKKHADASIDEVRSLLQSPVHECRLTALFILLLKNRKATPEARKSHYDFYLKNIRYINNWDLVDLSARDIVGGWLLHKPEDRKLLYRLARSDNLWERRIAVLSCFAFLRERQFDDAFAIAEVLLHDPHDLIHKAVGWMLREIGKIDEPAEEVFLRKHAKTMPRTMLRYAIERFEEKKRQRYLKI